MFLGALVFKKRGPIRLFIRQTFIEHLLVCLRGQTQGVVRDLSISCVGFFLLVIEVILMEMVSLATFK